MDRNFWLAQFDRFLVAWLDVGHTAACVSMADACDRIRRNDLVDADLLARPLRELALADVGILRAVLAQARLEDVWMLSAYLLSTSDRGNKLLAATLDRDYWRRVAEADSDDA